jgi:cupin fold WbuC family metalloprotein
MMAMVTFDDQCKVTNALRFGSEKPEDDMAVGDEVPFSTWHTVIALELGCVVLDVKVGPFDPNQPKDLAPWAPEEGTSSAVSYLHQLMLRIKI